MRKYQCCALSVLCTSARISGPREGFRKPQRRKLLQAESRPQPLQCSCFFQPNILKTLIPPGRLVSTAVSFCTTARIWTAKVKGSAATETFCYHNPRSVEGPHNTPFNRLPSATGCHSLAVLHFYSTASPLPTMSLLSGVHSLRSLLAQCLCE